MAQSDSNLDLTNGAIIHSPVGICSDLDTQRGRDDEEGEEEDEEVELAEEVGEDILLMAGEEEGIDEGESREQSEQIIEVELLPNGVEREEEGGIERPEENRQIEVEVGEEEHEMTDEQTQQTESKVEEGEELNITNTDTDNPCSTTLAEIERGQDLLDSKEEKEETNEKDTQKAMESLEAELEDDENNDKEVKESSETEQRDNANNARDVEESVDSELRADKSDEEEVMEASEAELREVGESFEAEIRNDTSIDGDEGLEEEQGVSVIDDAEHVQDCGIRVEESAEAAQSSTEDTEKDQALTDAEGEESVEDPDISHTSTVCETQLEATIEVESNQLTSGESDEINTEVETRDSVTACLQVDYIEAKAEDEGAISTPDDALEATQNVEQPDPSSAPSEEQLQTEVGIEEARVAGINREVLEEEQVRQLLPNTLTVMDGGGQSGEEEEEGKTDDNVVSESLREEESGGKGDREMQQESGVEVEKQAQVDLPEPVQEQTPSDTQQHVDVDQVEEAFELEEEGEVEPQKPGVEAPCEADERAADLGGDLQEHHSQLLGEAETDWGEKLKEQLEEQTYVEDEKGGGAETDMMEGDLEMAEDVEMAEEPVTVLDDYDEIEDIPSGELEEQKPSTITAQSPDTTFETMDGDHQRMQTEETIVEKKDGEHQERQEDAVVETKVGDVQETQKEKVELIEGNDEKQRTEVEKDKGDNTRDEDLDINGRVRGLKQAMENGIMSPEPQPPRREELSMKRPSLIRRDNDWIKKDQSEDEGETEVKDWRQEVKPVKKEPERGRKEWVRKEPEEKSPPRQEDWIKELKSVIKDDSLPRKRDERVKKKRVVLLEDGHSYFPQREEVNEKREEVTLLSHRRVGSPLPPLHSNSNADQDQEYQIALYVKVLESVVRA